jgi:hypothetical protein
MTPKGCHWSLSPTPSIVQRIRFVVSERLLITLTLWRTEVSDVSALASCQSLDMLVLWKTKVSDISALASCQSLHTADLSETDTPS